jgi:hypothetical protein
MTPANEGGVAARPWTIEEILALTEVQTDPLSLRSTLSKMPEAKLIIFCDGGLRMCRLIKTISLRAYSPAGPRERESAGRATSVGKVDR